jgi:hypothetical protein
MSTRTLVIALGVVVVLVSLFADALGLGQEARFGWKQTAGVMVGLIIVVAGLGWRRISR